MPRELRSRKVSTENDGPTKAQVEKTTTVKSKRKEAPAESDSPIPRKLQKGGKKAIAKEEEEPVVKVTKTTKTKTPAKKEVQVEEQELVAESESEGEEQEEEEVQKLAAELDPEQEEQVPEDEAVMYKPGQAVGKIPDVSDAVEQAAKATSDGDTGVIYIGRIPHGFYEHEMKQYLTQFGPINKLRLSRNKKTGASKHFAFVEFAESSTAEIVAKTMNNYLLFGHILKCRTIPKDQVRSDLFKGANKRFKKVPWNKMAGMQLEKPRSEAAWEKKVAVEQSKRAKKAAKLKEMGYDFDAPALREVPPPGAVIEEPVVEEVRAEIEEAPAAEANGNVNEAEPVEVVEKVVTEKPGKKEVEVEVTKSISAPKTKTKATKSRKSKV